MTYALAIVALLQGFALAVLLAHIGKLTVRLSVVEARQDHHADDLCELTTGAGRTFDKLINSDQIIVRVLEAMHASINELHEWADAHMKGHK